MDRNDIIWRLAELASLPFQERYVIGGTDEYVIAVELIENVDALKYLIYRPENRHLLDPSQLAALEDLFGSMQQHSAVALQAETRDAFFHDLRHGPAWRELRLKASYALSRFGVLGDLSVEEVDRFSED